MLTECVQSKKIRVFTPYPLAWCFLEHLPCGIGSMENLLFVCYL